MTAIGGFFELELPAGGSPYHRHALALSSGRACLRRILERLAPARVWTPFYVCDAVLPAIAHAGAEVAFYTIDEALEPVLPLGQPAAGDAVMYVNYFGVKGAAAASLASSFGRRSVIDDTQAFFQTGYPGAWSFNSARKFFGVPDGGYAYGDGLDAAPIRPPSGVRYDHLITRLLGDQERAFQQYRDSEACVSDEPVSMSPFAARLMAGVDSASVRRRREDNFARLHTKLGERNRLRIPADAASAGPYCYPLLLDTEVPWQRIWDREVFAPQLWAEIERRSARGQFLWERQLAARLLPLPIDQRYGAADMDRVVAVVAEVMQW